MYLRWQYVGPSWIPEEGKTHARRLTDKRPVASEAGPLSRYRLSAVESRRIGGRVRVQVVLYLGIVDEARLHPQVRGQRAFAARNRLLESFGKKLTDAVASRRLDEDEREALRAAINRAFPKMHPPPGRSYVIIPARVAKRAKARWEKDVEAFEDQRKDVEIAGVMGMPVEVMRHFLALAEAEKAQQGDGHPADR